MRSKSVDSRQSAADSKTVIGVIFKSIAADLNQGKQMQLSVVRLVQRLASLKSTSLHRIALMAGLFFSLPAALLAQNDTTQTHTVDMATTMRSNGKIYVVVTVLVIILLGIFLYLIRLDRKIGKLEKE